MLCLSRKVTLSAITITLLPDRRQVIKRYTAAEGQKNSRQYQRGRNTVNIPHTPLLSHRILYEAAHFSSRKILIPTPILYRGLFLVHLSIPMERHAFRTGSVPILMTKLYKAKCFRTSRILKESLNKTHHQYRQTTRYIDVCRDTLSQWRH